MGTTLCQELFSGRLRVTLDILSKITAPCRKRRVGRYESTAKPLTLPRYVWKELQWPVGGAQGLLPLTLSVRLAAGR